MFIVCYTSHISENFQLVKQMFQIEIHRQILFYDYVLIFNFMNEISIAFCSIAHHTIRISDFISEKCLFTIRIAKLISRFCFNDY